MNKKIENQNKFSGKVSDISDTDFVLTNRKTGQARGWPTPMFEVRPTGMSKGAKILIVGLVVVGTVIGMGFALA